MKSGTASIIVGNQKGWESYYAAVTYRAQLAIALWTLEVPDYRIRSRPGRPQQQQHMTLAVARALRRMKKPKK